MPIGIEELREVMVEAGIEEQTARSLDPAAPLLKQGLDSVDFPAFAVAVEDHYGIRIEESEAFGLRTLNDFAAYIERRRGSA